MAEITPPVRRKRQAPVASVIEATAAAPMPVVDMHVVDASPAENAAAPEPATPPAAVPAEPQKETIMNTETVTQTVNESLNATGDKAQAFFGDAKARAEGAMQKGAQLVEELSAFGKGNLEAMVESSKIAARGIESLGQEAVAYAKTSFEQQSAAFRQLAAVKSPTEFMKLQGELVRQSFDQMVAQGSRQTETVLKLAGEVAQPISNRMAVAAEKIKVAA